MANPVNDDRLSVIQSSLQSILQFCKLNDDVSNHRKGLGNNSNNNKDRDKDKGGTPAFPFAQIVKDVFGCYPVDLGVDLFIDIFEYLPDWLITHQSGHLYAHAGLTKSTPVAPLIFQVLFFFLSEYKMMPSGGAGKKNARPKSSKSKGPHISPRPIDIERTKRLLLALLPLDFPIEAKVWNKAAFILALCPKKDVVGPFIAEQIGAGRVSFVGTIFFMHHDIFSRFLTTPEALKVAVCIGPLRATTVESFVSQRPPEFRDSCRQLLRASEQAAIKHTFLEFCPSQLHAQREALKWTVDKFEANVKTLIAELNGVYQHETLINAGWAFAAIKKYLKKTYVDQEWAQENLHELLWTVLKQRPNLRGMVVKMLQTEYHDMPASQFWRKVDLNRAPLNHIPWNAADVVLRNPLLPLDSPFLNFPSDVSAFTFVESGQQLQGVIAFLSSLIDKTGQITVALDAEWSAYSAYSAASILQLALRHSVFIIDVEEIPAADLVPFMEFLFANEKILKIGFQFHEDLLQLRNRIPRCPALYRPANLICIGKLVATLVAATEARPGLELLMEEFGMADEKEKGDESQEGEDDEADTSIVHEAEAEAVVADAATTETPTKSATEVSAKPTSKAEKRVLSRGLSALCDAMLGRPLDKREQCSVWSRRPLRSMQLRYAAMDAFCLLLLYSRSVEWAGKLGISIEEVRRQQSPPSASLPLFFGD